MTFILGCGLFCQTQFASAGQRKEKEKEEGEKKGNVSFFIDQLLKIINNFRS